MYVNPFFTVTEAARRRNVSRNCIITAIYSGRLKATINGNSYLILESDFQEYLKALRKPGRPVGSKPGSKIASIRQEMATP
jgi:excisionase family DNA binding protein